MIAQAEPVLAKVLGAGHNVSVAPVDIGDLEFVTSASRPLEIILAGGGHAHVFVLKAFGLMPAPSIRLTVIAKELSAPYSGMLPGFVAGHYTLDECHIDLKKLAAFAGARLIQGEVTGIDRTRKHVQIAGQAPLSYDLVSFGVGITPDLREISGADQHAIAVKPVSVFAPKWQSLEARALTSDGPRRIAAIGGGAAGVELILAARHRLRTMAPRHGIDPHAFSFSLIAGSDVLPSHISRARTLARRALADAEVAVFENTAATHIAANYIRLESGREVAADAVLVSTKAAAPAWFATTDMPLDGGGFLALRPTLQLLDDDTIFAGGDCATVIEHPRAKAGVFAVRQGPVLADNIRRVALGMPAQPFEPQTRFLTLVSLGGTRAIAARGAFAAEGSWAWRLKDRIDRGFVDGFNSLGR